MALFQPGRGGLESRATVETRDVGRRRVRAREPADYYVRGTTVWPVDSTGGGCMSREIIVILGDLSQIQDNHPGHCFLPGSGLPPAAAAAALHLPRECQIARPGAGRPGSSRPIPEVCIAVAPPPNPEGASNQNPGPDAISRFRALAGHSHIFISHMRRHHTCRYSRVRPGIRRSSEASAAGQTWSADSPELRPRLKASLPGWSFVCC